MNRPFRPSLPYRWSDFALMLASVAGTTVILILLKTYLSTQVVALLYLLPVMLSAARWGMLPALGASLISFFAFNFFFLTPTFTFFISYPEELLALLVFLTVAVLISQLVSAANLHAARAREREAEATTLYDLARALGEESGLENALTSVCRLITQAFDLSGCTVLLQTESGTSPARIAHFGIGSGGQETSPDLGQARDIPLTAHQKSVGTIRLETRRSDPPIELTTIRLVTTFASQLGLYLERERLAREADRAALLEESDRLKSALLSSVSHDLRTPLSAIKASATVLLQEEPSLDPAARFDLLSAINEETDRLNHLVGDLLDQSRIEAGALRLKRDWCDMDELIRGVVRRHAPQLAAFRVEFHWPEDLPLIRVDYVQVDRVVSNLLENALRYTPHGSVIQIDAEADSREMTVSVSNQGPAIPPALQSRLFEKFYRVSEERSEDMETGLGLSICKGIVEAHGGRIWLVSPTADGSGARFVFTLPFSPDSAVVRLDERDA